MKRLLSAVFACVLLFSSASIASASEITPFASSYFDSYTITVSSPSTAKVKFVFHVTAVGKADTLGVNTFYIERKNSDGTYTTVYTDTVNHTKSDVSAYTYSYTYTGSSGSSYRAVATFYCKKGSGSATTVIKSGTKTAS